MEDNNEKKTFSCVLKDYFKIVTGYHFTALTTGGVVGAVIFRLFVVILSTVGFGTSVTWLIGAVGDSDELGVVQEINEITESAEVQAETVTQVAAAGNIVKSVGGSECVDFGKNTSQFWELLHPEAISLNLLDGTVSLKAGATKSTFRNRDVIGSAECFRHRIVPYKSDNINYQVIRNEVYQLTIGDNDPQAVSLWAPRTTEGVFEPVYETVDKSSRPRLSSAPVLNKDMVVTQKESYSEESGKYSVEVEISYYSDSDRDELKVELFTFSWSPQPGWRDVNTVSVALIGDGTESGNAKVNIIEPVINFD